MDLSYRELLLPRMLYGDLTPMTALVSDEAFTTDVSVVINSVDSQAISIPCSYRSTYHRHPSPMRLRC